MYAAGLAEAVHDGTANLRQALAAQLQGNFFPPLPLAYIDPIIEALTACNEGDWERAIILSDDLNPLPRVAEINEEGQITIKAGNLVDITRTGAFIEIDS
jgi:hypothetical protein